MEKLDYVINEVENGVYAIDEYQMNYMYVVLGSDRALVIDTGTGTGDFRNIVERLTMGLPYDVVCTHGHVDHCGGIGQFEKVYIHPMDIAPLTTGNGKDGAISIFNRRRYSARGFAVNPEGSLPFTMESFKDIDTTRIAFVPIREGFAFNLGNRQLEVYEAPGHTPGCICLLDRTNRLLFAGDNPSRVLILPGEESDQERAAYWLSGAEKVMSLKSLFDTVYAGHFCPVPKGLMEDQVVLAKRIISGESKLEYLRVDEFKGPLYHYGQAYMTMDPENLKTRNYKRIVDPDID